MKLTKAVSLVVIVFVMIVSSAISETDIVTVQTPDEFRPHQRSFESMQDGKVLVCGSIGKPSKRRGAMYIFDTEGNITELTPPEDRHEGLYRDAFFIDDNTMIALRSVPNEFTWRIARLEDGNIIWTTEKTENVFDIERVGDKFFVYCKPEPVTAEIRCMDFDGNEEWRIRLEERITLEGILLGEDMHIAYGSKMEDPIGDKDQRSISLVFAFDNDGNILWRHNGIRLGYSMQYIDAVWAGDDELIAISVAQVCKYNKDGQLWERDYTANGMTGIVPIENGYLISYNKHGQNGRRFIRINEEGEITGEFYLHDGPGGTEKLLLIDGMPYMVLYNSSMNKPVELMKIDIEECF